MSHVLVKYLKDYQRPFYLISTTHLEFDIYDDKTIVKNDMAISREGAHDLPLVLDGEDLNLISVHLNEKPLSESEYKCEEDKLILFNLPASFTLSIITEIAPHKNTALEGLYKTKNMYCTQCEAQGFRRITYYLDRPDVMASFRSKIIADKTRYPVLLSNGNKINSGALENNRHFAEWHDPFLKPCYLFALVAGDLAVLKDHYTTVSGRRVALEIYAAKEDITKCEHAMSSLKQSMRWDETVYGREYDLDVYMIVAASDFNMGAMENKGLNIFNTKYVLANQHTSTDLDFQQVHAVIGHEYFHNWTGNRITCRDWFQLSLKEGLTVFRDQQFTADHFSAAVKRIDDVKILRSQQFAEDASPMSHPVRPESYIEMNNFYTVTVYNKGAEVIRMQHTLLGHDTFRKAMDLYFTRHDGQAITCDDFVACMEEASGRNLSQFKRWYSQAGTPIVTVKDEYDAKEKIYRIHLSQTCPATPGQSTKLPFHIPIKLGLIGANGHDLLVSHLDHMDTTHVLELTQTEQSFKFNHVLEPPTPSILRDFSAPVKIEYPYTETQLLHLMAYDSNPFNRWDAAQTLFTLYISKVYQDILKQQALTLSSAFIEAVARTLKSAMDPALIAETLTPPSEKALAETIPLVNTDVLHDAREFVLASLAQQLRDDFHALYQKLHDVGNDEISAEAMAKRRLKNTCLHYLMQVKDPTFGELALKQFQNAPSMTDEQAALSALCNSQHTALAESALKAFYQKWQHEDLVIDKWLQLQASRQTADTLLNVQSLTQHIAFDIKNPNKVYALLLAFSHNMLHFHRADGSSYRFIGSMVKTLNDINPQVAARLVRSLMNWRKFDLPRQKLMHDTLKNLSGFPLSKDVYEIVSKSL